MVRGVSRRDFVKYTIGTVAGLYLSPLNIGSAADNANSTPTYPIDSTVYKSTQRMLSFPMPGSGLPPAPTGPNSGTGLYLTELPLISQYSKYGYGNYTWGAGLPIVQRFDIMPSGYGNTTPTRLKKFANFFTFTDIHITDKESPVQFIYIQQQDATYGGPSSSIYSPIMMYTTHVLDAAMQTINALHEQNPFDFGISLGDACNCTQYNELRWYIDVIDGKTIIPSSGAHLGATTIDYQKPYQAAGLNKSIPWYQTLGNHDHFMIGSVAVDADPTLNIRQAFIGSNVWAIGDLLMPQIQALIANPNLYPCTHDTTVSILQRSFYMGVLDGSTPTGDIIYAGPVGSITPPPTVAADPNRRSLMKTEWIQEFFNTTSNPVGHGLNLVDPSYGSGFACYSFMPKSDIPLKIIVLDDTQSNTDGSHDIHGHGYLDATRWSWLQAELAAGQAANQLMIIAAHIPIAVASIGSEVEWWEPYHDPNATVQNAVSLTNLVATLQNTPNLIMWISGHRHLNTVKAFVSPTASSPEKGFWQVETSSLRDFPQQLRTFEIYLNSDFTVSIVTTNLDPAMAAGTPAAKSRFYSIATQQILQTNLIANNPNVQTAAGFGIPVETMDPTRPQDGSQDPTIKYGSPSGVPYCASYNAELFKQLSPTMKLALQNMYSNAGNSDSGGGNNGSCFISTL
ncbi:MAG: TIGR03768 family metallophosphoesterase [Deltaproteobacteria bacterium]|nr:TIGR03768 family metallophosphoesterase [Deltaproteobacteria bacterium]